MKYTIYVTTTVIETITYNIEAATEEEAAEAGWQKFEAENDKAYDEAVVSASKDGAPIWERNDYQF